MGLGTSPEQSHGAHKSRWGRGNAGANPADGGGNAGAAREDDRDGGWNRQPPSCKPVRGSSLRCANRDSRRCWKHHRVWTAADSERVEPIHEAGRNTTARAPLGAHTTRIACCGTPRLFWISPHVSPLHDHTRAEPSTLCVVSEPDTVAAFAKRALVTRQHVLCSIPPRRRTHGQPRPARRGTEAEATRREIRRAELATCCAPARSRRINVLCLTSPFQSLCGGWPDTPARRPGLVGRLL